MFWWYCGVVFTAAGADPSTKTPENVLNILSSMNTNPCYVNCLLLDEHLRNAESDLFRALFAIKDTSTTLSAPTIEAHSRFKSAMTPQIMEYDTQMKERMCTETINISRDTVLIYYTKVFGKSDDTLKPNPNVSHQPSDLFFHKPMKDKNAFYVTDGEMSDLTAQLYVLELIFT
ncbi:hypothetical protein ECANGB1_1480 [Enterospora canceri]|uniref:Uncharacterized protein n=1 Tax=Enterospora canceri TaxID=1081671 RepID=A0A1Y1S6P0_9MICR|nr:hypothetical protein ECANGB1_1480 [Enterospora canceri]